MAGVAFRAIPSAIDEMRREGEPPLAYARRLAREKAEAVAAQLPCGVFRVLGADTIVIVNGEILGKPSSTEDAVRMLKLLSGRAHQVVTAVCLLAADASGRVAEDVRHATTLVRFRALTEGDIRAYVESGEPMDKAGAYAIQGGAADFVQSYEGDYENVVGLPVALVLAMLAPGA